MVPGEPSNGPSGPPAGQDNPQVAGQRRTPARRGGIHTFSSLQNNRDYRFLLGGNLFANAAQWLQFVTVGWLALDVSGSPLHSIMAVAVRALPTLLLGPWSGVIADRWDRRRLAMASQVALAVSALGFALLLTLERVDTIWYVYGYTVLTGIASTVTQPARQALIANTVRRSDLANALALNAMAVTSMRLLGAAVAGVLIQAVDFQWNFYLEGGLYLGMTLLLIPMGTPYREASAASRVSPIADLVEGVGYIMKNRTILRLLLVNFARTAIFGPLLLLLPAYASEALGAGPGVGTTMIVSMGIGGVIASLAISSWGFQTKKGLVCLISLITGSGVFFTLGLSQWIWYSVPIMFIMGLSQTYFIVSNQTLIQTIVPDALRGRVSSVWHYEQGMIPLFSGLIGLLAAFIGIALGMTWFGGAALALGLIFLIWFKDVRALD